MNDKYARTNNLCLVILTVIALTGVLIYTKLVLLPFIFSIFLYSIMTPFVYWIQKKTKIPRGFAIVASIFILFLSLTFVVGILISSIENFVEGAPKYRNSLNQSLQFVENQLVTFNIDFDLQKIREFITGLPLMTYAKSATSELFNFLGNLFLVFIFTIFMMAGETRNQPKSRLLKKILNKVSLYISSKSSLSLITGFTVWLILLIFNVELAFIFGLLTFLLNFIPTVGSIVAVVLPLPIVFLQYQLSWQFFLILILSGAVQFIIGNVVEPRVMGDTMDLHPITVLFCLMFWGLIWGTPGMFLAVPITATLKIIFNRIEATQIFSEILAGRIPTRE